MKRRTILALPALALPCAARPAERFAHGLLWRVGRKGGPSSHVFGTIHDPRVAPPPEARTAFADAKSLLVEFLPDAHARERFLEAGLLSDGRTLDQLIGPEDFALAAEQLAPIGLDRAVVKRLKPWAALLSLRAPDSGDAPSMDVQLVAAARARRLVVEPLESVEEQVFIFDEFPMEVQVALLKHSLTHRDELIALGERTAQAYRGADLAAIARLREDFARRYPEITAYHAAMTRRMVHDRSVVMAYRMQRELRRGSAFVAIGALHLHGQKGVLALLEADGYRAARVL